MVIATLSTTADDCYGRASGSVFSISGTGLELGKISDDPCKAWIPFTAVPFLKNTVIVSSTIKLVANNTRSGATCKLRFGCEAADNPSAPSTWATLNSRTMSAAYTDDNNVAAQTAGTEYTWNITTAVQEILNRAGWASGNTLAVLIHENGGSSGSQRTVASFDNTTYAEPKLVIEYLLGGQVMTWESE